MKQINRDIRAFVTDPAQPATYTFPPMEKAMRKRIHSLALLCNLDSKSKGKARQRYLFLTRTRHTKKATNFEALDRLVAEKGLKEALAVVYKPDKRGIGS